MRYLTPVAAPPRAHMLDEFRGLAAGALAAARPALSGAVVLHARNADRATDARRALRYLNAATTAPPPLASFIRASLWLRQESAWRAMRARAASATKNLRRREARLVSHSLAGGHPSVTVPDATAAWSVIRVRSVVVGRRVVRPCRDCASDDSTAHERADHRSWTPPAPPRFCFA